MFSFDTKELENDNSQNVIISKKIEVDQNLDCFIIIASENKKILTPLLNKIVDYVLDNLTLKDTYNKLSVTLESVNFLINNVKKKEENNIDDLSVIIGVLEKNNFHFSKIGEASCYLINKNNEFIEISDPSTKITEFDFISSGKLTRNEKVILSNKRLSDFLTQSDLDELGNINELEVINENIINIIKEEKIKDNVKVLGIEYNLEGDISEKKVYIETTKNIFYSALDNNFSKKAIALFMILKDKVEKRGKIAKNVVFVTGILISAFLLYSILSGIIGKTIEGGKNEEYKNYLIEARDYLRLANENIANPEAFDLNIKKAEELALKVKEENLYLNDVSNVLDDISIVKKQFNGIETFETSTTNLVFKGNFSDGVKLLESDKKLYVIGKSSLYGPIIQGQNLKNNVFEQLEVDDEFIDGSIVGDSIILVTKKSRLVSFSKDGTFKYINVLGQTSWEESSFIEAYNSNIYLTNTDGTQLYMHSPAQSGYNTGIPYLNDADTKTIGKILAVGIDGGIYMLKKDLSLIKFFRSPKYKIQSIVLNKLPKNYSYESGNVKLVTKPNLSLVYMLLNNKVWIFQPNTRISSDTKSLMYLGQIEGKNEQIISFDVSRDNEINAVTKTGVYKIGFDIKDEKVIVR